MADRSDQWAEVNGVCLRYRLSGSGSETLVLVHEMAGMIESWDDAAPLLVNDFRVLRYDQRGFGLSEKGALISLPAMVDDLAALLDHLQITGPVCLAGAALGAAICVAFAVAYPQRVRRMVVSSPATGGSSTPALARLQAWLDQVQQGGIRAITDNLFAVTYPPAMRGNVESYERHRRRWLTVDPESFIALNRMLMQLDLVPELPRIECPTLVIGCTHDSIRPPTRCVELAQLIPGARFIEAVSGHYLPIQTPALFAALVRQQQPA